MNFSGLQRRIRHKMSIRIVCQLPKSSTSLMLSPSYQTISSTSRNWFHTTGTMEPIWVFTTEFGCFQTHSISLWEGTTYHSSCSYYQMVVASSCSFQIYFKVLHFFLSWSILKSHQTVFKNKDFNTRCIIFWNSDTTVYLILFITNYSLFLRMS